MAGKGDIMKDLVKTVSDMFGSWPVLNPIATKQTKNTWFWLWGAKLSSFLTKPQIELIKETANNSVNIANTLLSEDPRFSPGERFSLSAPVEDWMLYIPACLLDADKNFCFSLSVDVFPFSKNNPIALKREHIRATKEEALEKISETQKSFEEFLKFPAIEKLADEVSLVHLADTLNFSYQALPLVLAFDAVWRFSNYPKSLQQKLHPNGTRKSRIAKM